MRESFKTAVRNIARFGDTDIFPFPLERHVLHDEEGAILDLLEQAHASFFAGGGNESFLSAQPPINVSMLAQIGHTGFRWATQVDPLWNAYLLGLIVSVSPGIESARIPASERSVFSYRLKHDPVNRTLFDTAFSWRDFMLDSIERAKGGGYVVVCDVSDFYPRVYHHRIENALLQVVGNSDIPKRVDKVLSAFSPGSTSYGLPVGGNAARILAELALNSTDHLLRMNKIKFCRYVDDYHVFADTKEQAFRHLIFLSEKLLLNEGLSLQKSKTRVVSASEFIHSAQFVLGIEDPTNSFREGAEDEGLEAARFMRLHIRFDPYSADPEGDYERTRQAVEQFDVLGMLVNELGKSRIHGAFVKHLLKAAKALPDDVVQQVAPVLADNFATLAPVFPQMTMLIRDVADRIPADMVRAVIAKLVAAIGASDPALQLDLHRIYALRLLMLDWTAETEALLVSLFNDGTSSPLLRRDIILVMARWGNHHWLSDTLKNFHTLNPWERRACIVASYRLRDEGRHWRQQKGKTLQPFESLVQQWASKKAGTTGWEIPL